MWFKKKNDCPTLEFTTRQVSPHSDDNVIVIHSGKVVHGTIVKTPYSTFKCTLAGHTAEYMDSPTAIAMTKKKWESWYK